MPGTLVTDALAPELYDGTAITSNTTTNGDWTEVKHPAEVAIEVATGTQTGTDLTVDIEIQGADDDSGTNSVSYGRFATLDDDDDDVRRILNARVYKPYMRAVIITDTSTGSPSATPTITVVQPHLRREATTTA